LEEDDYNSQSDGGASTPDTSTEDEEASGMHPNKEIRELQLELRKHEKQQREEERKNGLTVAEGSVEGKTCGEF